MSRPLEALEFIEISEKAIRVLLDSKFQNQLQASPISNCKYTLEDEGSAI